MISLSERVLIIVWAMLCIGVGLVGIVELVRRYVQ